MLTNKEIADAKRFIYSLTRKKAIKPTEGIRAMALYLSGGGSIMECVGKAAPTWNPTAVNYKTRT